MGLRMRGPARRRAPLHEQRRAVYSHGPHRRSHRNHRPGQAAVEYLFGLAVAMTLVTASLAGNAPPLRQFLDAIASAWAGLLIALALPV